MADVDESMNISYQTLLKLSQPGGDATSEQLLRNYVMSVQHARQVAGSTTSEAPAPGPMQHVQHVQQATERKLAGETTDSSATSDTSDTSDTSSADSSTSSGIVSSAGLGNAGFNPNAWSSGLTVTAEDGDSGDVLNADALDVRFAMDLGTVEEAQTAQELFEQESFAVQLNMQLRRVALRMGTLETLPSNVYVTNADARQEMATRHGNSLLMENEVELNQLQDAYELEEEAAKTRSLNDKSGLGVFQIVLICIVILSCGGFMGYRHHMIKVMHSAKVYAVPFGSCTVPNKYCHAAPTVSPNKYCHAAPTLSPFLSFLTSFSISPPPPHCRMSSPRRPRARRCRTERSRSFTRCSLRLLRCLGIYSLAGTKWGLRTSLHSWQRRRMVTRGPCCKE
jgi:hypothetical protein